MARQCAQNFALQPGEATIARMVGASPVTVPVLERLRADGSPLVLLAMNTFIKGEIWSL
jgi:hypothetical protein